MLVTEIDKDTERLLNAMLLVSMRHDKKWEGPTVHDAVVCHACDALRQHGFRVVQEYPVAYKSHKKDDEKAGRLDIFGQKDGKTIALEVDTGNKIRIKTIRKLIISKADNCVIIHGGGFLESDIRDHAMNYARKTQGRVRYNKALELVSEIRFRRRYKVIEEQFQKALKSFPEWNSFTGQIFIIDVSARRNFKVTLEKEDNTIYCFLERIEITEQMVSPQTFGRQEPVEIGRAEYFAEWNTWAVLMDSGYYYVKQGRKIGEPLHKLIARKFIYRRYPLFFKKYYYRQELDDLDVHHIDRNKTNNQPDNLVIISRQEHRVKIQHQNIIENDRASGIMELKRVGIHAPHIKELEAL